VRFEKQIDQTVRDEIQAGVFMPLQMLDDIMLVLGCADLPYTQEPNQFWTFLQNWQITGFRVVAQV